jgi:hypothetical protein
LGDHSEYTSTGFWQKSAFCNFNQTFFPKRARVNLPYRTRTDPRNANYFRTVLQRLRPTHVIVWGITNWHSIDADSVWTREKPIPGTQEPYCSTTIDGHTILFARVRHPSTAFSPRYWNPVLSRFLQMRSKTHDA